MASSLSMARRPRREGIASRRSSPRTSTRRLPRSTLSIHRAKTSADKRVQTHSTGAEHRQEAVGTGCTKACVSERQAKDLVRPELHLRKLLCSGMTKYRTPSPGLIGAERLASRTNSGLGFSRIWRPKVGIPKLHLCFVSIRIKRTVRYPPPKLLPRKHRRGLRSTGQEYSARERNLGRLHLEFPG